jgi:hypothetical protein
VAIHLLYVLLVLLLATRLCGELAEPLRSRHWSGSCWLALLSA